MNQKEYFEKNIEKLNNQRDARQDILRQKTRELISPYCIGKVLDIGFGGRIDYLQAQAEELHLVDIFSTPAVNTGPKTIIYKADFLDLNLPENYFDNIFLLYVLHHLAKDTLQLTEKYFFEILKKAKSVLKPEGRVIILEGFLATPFSLLEKMFFMLTGQLVKIFNKPHIYYFSLQEIKEIAFSCNLKIDKIENIEMPSFMVTPFDLNIFIPYKLLGLNISLIEMRKLIKY